MATLTSNRWLNIAMINGFIDLLNVHHHNTMTAVFMLNDLLLLNDVDLQRHARSVMRGKQIKAIVFIINVAGGIKKTDVATPNKPGRHWSLLYIDAVENKWFYYDTLAWPPPTNINTTVNAILNVLAMEFPVFRKPAQGRFIAHKPEGNQRGFHQCTNGCFKNVPLQSCGSVCGVIVVVMGAISSLYPTLWRAGFLDTRAPISNEFLWLRNPTLHSCFLRRVLIHCISSKDIDLQLLGIQDTNQVSQHATVPGSNGTAQKPLPVTGQKPAQVTDQKPPPTTGQKTVPVTDQKPPPVTEQKPPTGTKQKPPPVTDKKPRPMTGQKSAPVTDQKPPPVTEQKPPTGTKQKPPPVTDQKPRPMTGQKSVPVTNQKPQTDTNQKPPQVTDQKPPLTTGQKSVPVTDQKPPIRTDQTREKKRKQAFEADQKRETAKRSRQAIGLSVAESPENKPTPKTQKTEKQNEGQKIPETWQEPAGQRERSKEEEIDRIDQETKLHRCPECDYICPKVSNMKRHMKRKHNLNSNNVTSQKGKCLCNECDRQFYRIKDLREHLSPPFQTTSIFDECTNLTFLL